MNLPPSFADQMSPYEFTLYRKGWAKAQAEEWRRTRLVTWMVQATQTEKPIPIEKLLPLPGDEPEQEGKPKRHSAKVAKSEYERLMSQFDTTTPEK